MTTLPLLKGGWRDGRLGRRLLRESAETQQPRDRFFWSDSEGQSPYCRALCWQISRMSPMFVDAAALRV